ncbi:MAG: hypothetical protein R3F46_03665 [bacterium]
MDTSANFQTFYFGNVSNCYGDAMIVGINAADGCDDFDEAANADWRDRTDGWEPVPEHPAQPGVRCDPGPLGRRRRQPASSSATGASPTAANTIGWPVARPFAFNNGAALLNANGAYYAFGQFFEKGFACGGSTTIRTTTRRRATKRRCTCTAATTPTATVISSKVEPDVFYGGSGDLGVNVIPVDGVRYGAGDWSAPQLPDDNTYYQIGMLLDENLGISSVTVAASAHAFGGATADVDVGHPEWGNCLYKHSTWSWRDGTVWRRARRLIRAICAYAHPQQQCDQDERRGCVHDPQPGG